MIRKYFFLLSGFLLVFFSITTHLSASSGCERPPLPAPTETTVTVRAVEELVEAARQANAEGHLTILLEDGTYTLNQMIWIDGDHVTFRSRSGDRDAVIIRGQGMSGTVSHIFNIAGKHFTVADMTIGWVATHAIQIHGEGDFADASNGDLHHWNCLEGVRDG